MKLHDISRELLSAPLYAGDPAPRLSKQTDVALGDVSTVSTLSLCLHNGTHMDAPCHFFPDADAIPAFPLEQVCGECTVLSWDGVLLGADAEHLLRRVDPYCERILFRGSAQLSQSAAFVLSAAGIKLIGVEGMSISTAAETATVHRELLSQSIALLEGLDLSAIREGTYFLFAAPLKIAGADGAPVRAVLVER